MQPIPENINTHSEIRKFILPEREQNILKKPEISLISPCNKAKSVTLRKNKSLQNLLKVTNIPLKRHISSMEKKESSEQEKSPKNQDFSEFYDVENGEEDEHFLTCDEGDISLTSIDLSEETKEEKKNKITQISKIDGEPENLIKPDQNTAPNSLLNSLPSMQIFPNQPNNNNLQIQSTPISQIKKLSEKERSQVEKDIERSLHHFDFYNALNEETASNYKVQLRDMIIDLLEKNSYGYYQGYNDFCSVFLLILGKKLGYKVAEAASKFLVKDFLLDSFDKGVKPMLLMLNDLIKVSAPDLYEHFEKLGVFFILKYEF